ncbi:unnamed protein product [Orchesella dallaii]|uniref:Glutaredoxin-3 n=1 Tax=Orchesella dallaii TaxID=48710 RepID=A0ABP1QYU0_9HEXA
MQVLHIYYFYILFYYHLILFYFYKINRQVKIMTLERLVSISKPDELEKLLNVNKEFVVVVTFVAPWSTTCKNMMDLTREFVSDPEFEHILFCEIAAEEFPAVAQKYDIKSVPSVLFFRGNQITERLIGADVQDLTNKVMEHANKGPSLIGKPTRSVISQAPAAAASPDESLPLNDRLKSLINQANIMIFMKGNPEQPRCGFSRQVIEIINATGLPYVTFDILENEEVRQGLKDYSQWQTYPQIYVRGELMGGLDIIKEMRDTGALNEALAGV